jgi:hypothetical protein
MTKFTSEREHTRPANIPVDLNQARLKLAEAFQLLGYALLCLFVAVVGASLGLAAAPWANLSTGGFRLVVFLFGAGVAGVSLWLAASTTRLTVQSWTAYLDWCWMYVEVDVAGREQTGNVEKETEIQVWELTVNNPRDILIAALGIYWATKQGKENAHAVREMQGDMWLDGIRLGNVNTTQAQRLGKALGLVGLIEGRGNKSSGTWKAESADDVLHIVAQNWQKVRDV